jgi:hypothetical protein
MDDRQRRGTNNAGQSGEERKVKRVEMWIPTMAVLRTIHVPRTWTGWGSTSRPVELRCTGSARRMGNTRRSDMTDYFYVTSEAREGCEHAS